MADSRRTPSRGPRSRARSGPGRGTSGRARASGATATTAVEAPRPRLTGRAAVLVLVLAVLMVSYASSLRAYLQQRAQIEDLNAKIAERQTSIDDLEFEKSRFDDPAYVEQRAREQSGYVAPGDRSFVVLDADGNRIGGDASLQDPTTVIKQDPTAWWSTAWESVQLAGNPPKVAKPPATSIDGSNEPQE